MRPRAALVLSFLALLVSLVKATDLSDLNRLFLTQFETETTNVELQRKFQNLPVDEIARSASRAAWFSAYFAVKGTEVATPAVRSGFTRLVLKVLEKAVVFGDGGNAEEVNQAFTVCLHFIFSEVDPSELSIRDAILVSRQRGNSLRY